MKVLKGITNTSHTPNTRTCKSVGLIKTVLIGLKPQDSFGRFVKFFLDLQKVDHIIRKYH